VRGIAKSEASSRRAELAHKKRRPVRDVVRKKVTDLEAERIQKEIEEAKKKGKKKKSLRRVKNQRRRGREEDPTKMKPNEGNGANLPKYKWTQTLSEVELRTWTSESSKIPPPIIDGEFPETIKKDDSAWLIEDKKANTMSWWPKLVLSDPEINTKKIQPENSKLSDLDGETRSMPTSDEQKNKTCSNNSWLPSGNDFSNCKFS
ncbi:Nuclear migration protein nudC, partial [Caligus rogercresseyi]